MAENTDSEQLLYSIVVRLGDMEKQLKRAADSASGTYRKMQQASKSGTANMAADAERATNRINKALSTTSKNIGDMSKAYQSFGKGLMSSVSKFALPVIGVGSIAGLAKYADTWSDLKSRVSNSVGSMEQSEIVMNRLREVADRTYSPLEATAESFLKNAQSLKALGYSTQTQLDFTEALNNALVVSATKGDKAAAVQDALGKAMASGKLNGQNLNTVIESGGRFAQALADSMGINVMELRKYGAQGKITTDVLVGVISQQEKLREEAENMPATLSDGLTRLGNSLLAFIGNLDQATGVSDSLAKGMIFLSENMNAVAIAAAAAGSILLAQNAKYLAGLTKVIAKQAMVIATNPYLLIAAAIGAAAAALVIFSDQIYPIQGELATLGDYGVEAWEMIKEASIMAQEAISENFNKLIDFITESMNEVNVSWGDVWEVIKGISNKIIGMQMTVAKVIITTFTNLPAAIADGVISAANFMVEKIEDAINAVISGVNAAIQAINSIGGVVGATMNEVSFVTFERIENKYAGAGKAAGEAYMDAFNEMTKDHIGNAIDNASDIFSTIRERANKRAEERKNNPKNHKVDSVDKPISIADGGSGKKKKDNELERTIKQTQEQTKALEDQATILGIIDPLAQDYGYALTKLQTIQKLYNAAQKEGIQVTPEMAQSFEIMAEKAAQAEVEVKKLQESQESLKQKIAEVKDISRDMTRTFIDGMINGKSAAEALGDSLMRLGQRLIDASLDSVFDSIFSTGNKGSGVGNLLGGIGKLFGFATGTANTGGARGEARGIVHGQEAVIPLPNGGKVPVQVYGGQAQAQQAANATASQITVHVESSKYFDTRVQEISGDTMKQGLKEYDSNLSNTIGQKITMAQAKNRM